jgi:hypothetical protein
MVTLISLIGRNGRGGGWEAGSTDYTEALVLNGETIIRLLGKLFIIYFSVSICVPHYSMFCLCHTIGVICVFVNT